MEKIKYKRVLKYLSSGDDVFYIKNCLLDLGYFDSNITKITNKRYGKDTKNAVKSYQFNNKDTKGRKLEVDGKVGELTWNAIIRDYKAMKDATFQRTLKKGMSGSDVKYIKKCLYSLKYSPVDPVDSIFDKTVEESVKLYQRNNKDVSGKTLSVDGIVGEKTWNAIIRDFKLGKVYVKTSYLKYSQYPNITVSHIDAINKELEGLSETRKKIVAECLKYVYDKDTNIKKPISLYIYGANLYDKNLKLYYATESYINSRAKELPSYFNGGRKEWMLKQVKSNPKIPCSDCSGLEVGYMRKFGIIKPTADYTANTLCSSTKSTGIKKSELKPGDWVGKPGHIATYVGAGLAAEFVGGAYGGQLTDITTRKAYNFVTSKINTMEAWTKYRRPNLYD